MITADNAKIYLGASDYDNDDLINACLNDAVVLVDEYVGEATVPDTILDRCYLIVTADLWERRNAPNGIANQQFVTADGIPSSPVRIALDPLNGVYKILRRWVLPF